MFDKSVTNVNCGLMSIKTEHFFFCFGWEGEVRRVYTPKCLFLGAFKCFFQFLYIQKGTEFVHQHFLGKVNTPELAKSYFSSAVPLSDVKKHFLLHPSTKFSGELNTFCAVWFT